MYIVCRYICVCVFKYLLSETTGPIEAGIRVQYYTSHTPGCVTDMVNELGWESLEGRRQISRLCLLYKTYHGLIDIDKTAYLRPGDSRTRSHAGLPGAHQA